MRGLGRPRLALRFDQRTFYVAIYDRHRGSLSCGIGAESGTEPRAPWREETSMGRNLGIWVALALAIASMGCGTFNVQTDWDREVAFEELQRFHWVEPPEREDANPFADNTLLR